LRLLDIAYQYFGDADIPIDEGIVRRVREEIDPKYVPVLKKEMWQYASGEKIIFRNWGVGLEWDVSLPIPNLPVFRAQKPASGYLATLGRACAIVEWWPYQRCKDRTPGDTILPGGSWAGVLAYFRDCRDNMKALEARAQANDNGIPNEADANRAAAIKAGEVQYAERVIAEQREYERLVAEVESQIIKEEGRHLHHMMTEMTDEEYELVKQLTVSTDDQAKARVSLATPRIIL